MTPVTDVRSDWAFARTHTRTAIRIAAQSQKAFASKYFFIDSPLRGRSTRPPLPLDPENGERATLPPPNCWEAVYSDLRNSSMILFGGIRVCIATNIVWR